MKQFIGGSERATSDENYATKKLPICLCHKWDR